MRNKRRPPHRQCNCSENGENNGGNGGGENGGSAKKQFDTGDIAFEINMDGSACFVNITPVGNDAFSFTIRAVLTIIPETYTTITGAIKDILKKEHFLDYFRSIVKVRASNRYDTNIYINDQQWLPVISILPDRYIFIALPITTIADRNGNNITFYIPLLIDILNNEVYDVTNELPDEIIPIIDSYFTTILSFAYAPKKEYRLTMFACQLLQHPDTSHGIMTATGCIGRTGTNYGGATAQGTVTEEFPSLGEFNNFSIGYTFYEK